MFGFGLGVHYRPGLKPAPIALNDDHLSMAIIPADDSQKDSDPELHSLSTNSSPSDFLSTSTATPDPRAPIVTRSLYQLSCGCLLCPEHLQGHRQMPPSQGPPTYFATLAQDATLPTTAEAETSLAVQPTHTLDGELGLESTPLTRLTNDTAATLDPMDGATLVAVPGNPVDPTNRKSFSSQPVNMFRLT